MNIVQAAQARYSTKAFDANRKISADKMEALKELIRMSPSSVNSQPWHVLLASTDEGKARIAKSTHDIFAFNERKILDASHVLVFCTKTDMDEQYLLEVLESETQAGRFQDENSKQTMHEARSFFVNVHSSDLKDVHHWMEKQVYLNVGTLLLGAAAMNIDAVPIEGFDAKVLDEEFDLQAQGYTSSVIVPLGYHSEDDFNAKLPKSRLPQERIFTEY